MVLRAGFPPIIQPTTQPGLAQREEEEQVQREQVSRFERAVSRAGLPALQAIDLTQVMREAGVDVEDQAVQGFIQTIPDDLPGEVLQFYVGLLAQQYPAVPVTEYSTALEASGFSGALTQLGVTTPSEVAGLPREEFVVGAKGFSVHPDTGWIQYANGVLVNPSQGAAGVVFDPTSTAPGSPNWIRSIQDKWSDEKIDEWKKRLVEFGYLTKDQAKPKGIDQDFLDGIAAFHRSRYANFGKAVPTSLAGIPGTEAEEFELTARDFQAQIRNDVREQYRRIYGRDPSDAEVEEWARFTTRQASQTQRRFERRGATPSSALSLAAAESEELLVERLEGTPQAQYLQDQAEENTRLRDALSLAVVTTRSLAG
jgi:hypothetical protein